jgi:hypothetical protein
MERVMKHMQNTSSTPIPESIEKTTLLWLGQPFDTARVLYALAVRVGLIENSLLSSARFSRDIHSLEKMTLGPWARQV